MKFFNPFSSSDSPPTYCRRCHHNAPAHGYTEQDPRVGECTKCHCWGYYGDEHIGHRPMLPQGALRGSSSLDPSRAHHDYGLSEADCEVARKAFKVPNR
jgi:hypothetical protein